MGRGTPISVRIRLDGDHWRAHHGGSVVQGGGRWRRVVTQPCPMSISNVRYVDAGATGRGRRSAALRLEGKRISLRYSGRCWLGRSLRMLAMNIARTATV